MKARLAETGLYSFPCEADGGMAEYELTALACGLELAETALAELERESCAVSANGWGLTLLEDAAGIDNALLTAQERQNALLARGRASALGATAPGIVAGFTSLGLAAVLTEQPGGGQLFLRCSPPVNEPAERLRIAEGVRALLPSHLSAVLDFGTVNWDVLDAKELSWDAIDAGDLSWDEVDALGGAPLEIN